MSLESLLGQLEQSQLIRQALESEAAALGGAYEFEHALAQDSAYQSLLRARRRAIHRRVAECIERLYPDRLDENASLLARHYVEAGDDARALYYAERAGDAAQRKYALTEAIAHYEQGLELALRLDDSLRLRKLYGHRGRALELLGRHHLALANYEQMQMVCARQGNRQIELEALVHQTLLRSTANPLFDPAQAEHLAAQALGLARELGDGVAEARILWSQLNLYRFTNHNQEALALGEKAISLIGQQTDASATSPSPDLLEVQAFLLNDLGHVYTWTGHPDEATVSLRQATELWRQLDNRAMLADNLATSGLYFGLFGELDAARACAEESQAISDAIQNAWGQSYSRSAVGILHWRAGEMSQAIETMKDSIRFGQEAGYLVAQALMSAYLALTYLDVGAIQQGLEVAGDGLAASERNMPTLTPGLRAVLGHLLLASGDQAAAVAAMAGVAISDSDNPFIVDLVLGTKSALALSSGQIDDALAFSDQHVAYLQRHRFRLNLPWALHLRARALLAAGQTEAATSVLTEAFSLATVLGIRPDLRRILLTQAQMAEAAGDHERAEALRQQSRVHVDFIAGRIEEAGLREVFRGRVEGQERNSTISTSRRSRGR